jgi:hypothetical protein
MNPYTGASVIVNVSAAHNNGSPYAAALVTAVHPDGRVSARVLYDTAPDHPLARHRPEHLADVAFHDGISPGEGNKGGLYGAFWPAGSLEMQIAIILQQQEQIMTEVSQAQQDVNAAAAAFTSAASTISTVAADLGSVLSNVQAQLAALNAQIAALGTPVDTSALDSAVQGFAAPLAALQSADAALDAIETPAPSAGTTTGSTATAPATPVAAGDSGAGSN